MLSAVILLPPSLRRYMLLLPQTRPPWSVEIHFQRANCGALNSDTATKTTTYISHTDCDPFIGFYLSISTCFPTDHATSHHLLCILAVPPPPAAVGGEPKLLSALGVVARVHLEAFKRRYRTYGSQDRELCGDHTLSFSGT